MPWSSSRTDRGSVFRETHCGGYDVADLRLSTVADIKIEAVRGYLECRKVLCERVAHLNLEYQQQQKARGLCEDHIKRVDMIVAALCADTKDKGKGAENG